MEHTKISKGRLWTGRIMSGFVILFMLMDSVLKLIHPAPVMEANAKLGYAEHHVLPIGIFALLSTILYAIPRTSILGAVLLTAHLGGAVAAHVRIDDPLFSNTLFPVYIGILLWGGLWLRNEQLKQLIPIRFIPPRTS